jgi:hypothetical protein
MLSPLLSTPGTMTATTTNAAVTPDTWREWLSALFPSTYSGPMAPYHADFWDWLWAIKEGEPSRPYVAVWPRGWAKSTNGEAGAVALGAKGFKYVLYVGSKQQQADDHVQNIAARLEASTVAAMHPQLATPMVGKFGNQRAWRRNRVMTSGGFTVDAIGLDAAIRGAKLDDQRPDVIILDDVDEDSDSPDTIAKKIAAITKKILPAAAPNVVVMVLQNLVHRNGIVAQLVDGRADYLSHRIISGPHPAIVGLETEGAGKDAIITAGTPTWELMGLDVCQAKIGLFGLSAFKAECQHEVALSGQPRFNLEALAHYRTEEPLSDKLIVQHLRGVEGLRVYALPVPGQAYVTYIDPAEGKGRDSTATVVMEARSRRVVAVLEDNFREPQAHAEYACDLWEWYNRGLLGFERAKGEAVALVLGQRGVSRIYQHVDNPLTPQQRQAGIEEKRRPGFPMTEHTKRGLIDRLAGLIEAIAVSVGDKRMLAQLGEYIVTERMTTEAAPGSHDDLVIALAGAAMLAEQPGAQTLREATGQSNVRGYAPGSVPLATGRRPTTRAY